MKSQTGGSRYPHQITIAVAWIWGGLFLFSSGCQKSTPSPPEHTPAQRAQPAAQDAATTSDIGGETWDAIYLDEAKIGYIHTNAETIREGEQSLVRITSQTITEAMRFGQIARTEMRLESFETPDRQLVRLSSHMNSGGAIVQIAGEVQGDTLAYTTESQGSLQTGNLAWTPTTGGFFAMEQSVSHKPMKPGDTRTLRMLMPSLGAIEIIQNQLKAVSVEATRLLDRQAQLLKIESTVGIRGRTIVSHLWVNDQGEVLKTAIPSLGHVTYRTTRDIAIDESDMGSFDLGSMSVVPLASQIQSPHRTTRGAYRIHLNSGNPAEIFPQGLSQKVQAENPSTAVIDVTRVRPRTPPGADGSVIQPPTQAELQATSLLQTGDSAVLELARFAKSDVSNPWALAVELESIVKRSIRETSFSQAFASAADVARSRSGDCTEYAVLLGALCRAKGIPARVVTGLVYSAAVKGFAFHMWTEVWINDRWIPLDATLGLGGIGAAHIKLSHSNLTAGNDLAAILPVAQVLRQMQIEVVQIEH